jgi:hypothetical protein
MRGGFQGSTHLPRPFESESAVDGFSEVGRVQEDDRNPAGLRPSHRGADDPGCVAFAAMIGFGEHREEIRRGGRAPAGSWLQVGDPDAAACDGPAFNVHDEPDQVAGAHALAGPPSVDGIRRIEVPNRETGDRLPHCPPMTNEEFEVFDVGPTDDGSCHTAGLEAHDNRFAAPVNLEQG